MRLGSVLSASCLILLVIVQTAAAAAEERVARGEYIITYSGRRSGLLGGSGFRIKSRGQHFAVVSAGSAYRRGAARVPAVYDPVQAAADCAAIRRDPAVELCEPVFVDSFSALPDDPGFSKQVNMNNPSGHDINAPEGWDFWTGSAESVVAIIDSGINYSHPDLDNNIWINPGEVPRNGLDDDGNGLIDDIIGYNFFAENNVPWDCNGHGTHVAGIIAAEGDNARGVAGVQWTGKLLIAGVGECSESPDIYRDDIIQAMEYITDLKVNRGINITVVNLSIGGRTYSESYRQAVARLRNAGIVVVNAAGNEGIDIDSEPSYPCSFELDNIVCVGSVNSDGARSSFSNFGKATVDILAPGKDIVSTFKAENNSPTTIAEAELYAKMSGTSMAAPHVSGALGLLSTYEPELTYLQLIELLYANSKPLPGAGNYSRLGKLLDIAGILRAAASGVSDPDPNPEETPPPTPTPAPDDPDTEDPGAEETPVPTPDNGDQEIIKAAHVLIEAAQIQLATAKNVLPSKLKGKSVKKRKAIKKKAKKVRAARGALTALIESLQSFENEHGEVLRAYSPSIDAANIQELLSLLAETSGKVTKSHQKALWRQFEQRFFGMFGPLVNTIASKL